ncbi:hypothetical protein GQ457_16G019540 [Hibiscus cannabinus]
MDVCILLMHAGERTRIEELKPSSVEARRFVCSSFQLNEANTPSASSIQLNTAPFSSTSAPLAQLKLNNPEAAETRPAYGRVSYKHVDNVANSSNFNAAIEAFLKPSSSSSFENMLTTILTSRRYKEARFTGCPVSFGERTRIEELKPSSVEAWRFVCSSFQLNEANTPSASSIQLNTAPFSSTSSPLAQLKLNNPEAAETRPAYGRVSYKHVDNVANSSNFNAAIEAFLKPSSSSSFENMLTTILTSRRYKEARFTGCPVSRLLTTRAEQCRGSERRKSCQEFPKKDAEKC